MKAVEQLWARNKYLVMGKSQSKYFQIRQALKSPDTNFQEIEQMIEEAILLEDSKSQEINAYMHVWGYFKKKASNAEKEHFKLLLDKISIQ